MDPTGVTNLLGALALGAASGLNAWIPLLGLGIAQRTGVVELAAPFDVLGGTPALAVLGLLFVVDLVGDKVPVVDHVLHVVGVAVAPASGAVVVAAQGQLLSDSHPWAAALVGVALGGTVHAGRSALRPAVTVGSGGTGNVVVSAVEDALSLLATVLAILVPVLAAAFVAVLGWFGVRRWRRRRARRRGAAIPPAAGVGP